jgi:hypothetical protein
LSFLCFFVAKTFEVKHHGGETELADELGARDAKQNLSAGIQFDFFAIAAEDGNGWRRSQTP